MKKKISSLLIISLFFNFSLAFAKCDFKNDIKRKGNVFTYTAQCHHEVGVAFKNLKDRNKENKELRKTIELKDLALVKADERIMKWRGESYEQFDRLQKADKFQSMDNKLHFIAGIGLAVLSVWAASKAIQ